MNRVYMELNTVSVVLILGEENGGAQVERVLKLVTLLVKRFYLYEELFADVHRVLFGLHLDIGRLINKNARTNKKDGHLKGYLGVHIGVQLEPESQSDIVGANQIGVLSP